MLSDYSTLRWGKRRPFVMIGTIFNLVLISSIGLILGFSGKGAYWLLFAISILIQVATNFAQGAQQGLYPDLVASGQRGRFSAVKAFFELPVALLLVSFTTARLISSGNIWGAIMVVIIVLAASMLITLLVREKPNTEKTRLDWEPFFHLLFMTAVFTLTIIGVGQAVQFAGSLVERWQPSLPNTLFIGFIGLIAMCLTTGLGVWFCVRIGLAEEAQRDPSFSWWISHGVDNRWRWDKSVFGDEGGCRLLSFSWLTWQKIAFNETTRKLVYLPEKEIIAFQWDIQGLTKATLIGNSLPLPGYVDYQLPECINGA